LEYHDVELSEESELREVVLGLSIHSRGLTQMTNGPHDGE
jgi:hypothetical protein